MGEVTEAAYILLPEGAYVRHASTSKEEAMVVGCPECKVAPGERCVESDGVSWRKSLHQARHDQAIRFGARVRFIGGARVFYPDDDLASAQQTDSVAA